jgi:hypothetical protein
MARLAAELLRELALHDPTVAKTIRERGIQLGYWN